MFKQGVVKSSYLVSLNYFFEKKPVKKQHKVVYGTHAEKIIRCYKDLLTGFNHALVSNVLNIFFIQYWPSCSSFRSQVWQIFELAFPFDLKRRGTTRAKPAGTLSVFAKTF